MHDELFTTLNQKGASARVDSQSGKQAERLVVQVLLPILILASLFALFMRISQQADSSGMGAFSRWRGQRLARSRRSNINSSRCTDCNSIPRSPTRC